MSYCNTPHICFRARLFSKTIRTQEFLLECDNYEMPTFFKGKIAEKSYFSSFELFKKRQRNSVMTLGVSQTLNLQILKIL